MIEINKKYNIREANDEIANKIKNNFDKNSVFALNIMSSPGAGKTSLLEATIEALKDKYKLGVIEGDLQTRRDAERIEKFNIPVYQINTQGGCHLDAKMVEKALEQIKWQDLDILFIENVGNLVCPATWFIGEHKRAVILSTAEGEDKPVKYPIIFSRADIVLLNKMDIAQFSNFNSNVVEKDIANINKNAKIFKISCKTKEGLEEWYKWLENNVKDKR